MVCYPAGKIIRSKFDWAEMMSDRQFFQRELHVDRTQLEFYDSGSRWYHYRFSVMGNGATSPAHLTRNYQCLTELDITSPPLPKI